MGWVTVSRMPDIYESNARVYMNADEALTPLLHGIAVESDVDARLERMQRTLLSSTNMKKLIRMTDLDSRVKDDADREQMVARLQKAIILKPQTRNLFTVTYQDPDPRLAQSVVSNVLSLFMESSAGDSRNDIDSAQRFLRRSCARRSAKSPNFRPAITTCCRMVKTAGPDSNRLVRRCNKSRKT
jgi:uncharacterized protein involved in exopolysaccharide biosynthesis